MKTSTAICLSLAAVWLSAITTRAQTGIWFRVVATQETVIVSATPDSVSWTNHPAGGTATVHCTFWADGYWNKRLPLTGVEVSGNMARAWFTLGTNAAQAITCSHTLHLIANAKARYFADNPGGFNVALFDLYPAYLADIPVCPSGGIYMLGARFMDPLCSVGNGHSL
jgi:hypothetical protein